MTNPVIYFEIGCRDIEKTREFYSKLFDWNINISDMSAAISTGTKTGIEGHIASLGHEPHNYTIVYVRVDNIPSYLEKAKQLGGTVMVPETVLPDDGSFAWVKDIEGTIIGLWKPIDK